VLQKRTPTPATTQVLEEKEAAKNVHFPWARWTPHRHINTQPIPDPAEVAYKHFLGPFHTKLDRWQVPTCIGSFSNGSASAIKSFNQAQ
jgi:hypothetical protein